jgi:hypothetical protein
MGTFVSIFWEKGNRAWITAGRMSEGGIGKLKQEIQSKTMEHSDASLQKNVAESHSLKMIQSG